MDTMLPRDPQYFVEHLLELGRAVRQAVLSARAGAASLAGVTRTSQADTIYELDAQVEPIVERFCREWSREMPLVLIAEGLHDHEGREGAVAFPEGSDPAAAAVRIIIDPIDGTRGLMYDKRSAWFLAGVAPNRGEGTSLADIQVAVQVEIPPSKQTLADALWGVRGQGAHAVREDLATGGRIDLPLRPSQADTLAHGFAAVANFFPGTKVLAGALMEKIVAELLGPADVAKAMVFDDQYISTGGQFYELLVGHDRFTADLRPVFYALQNQPVGLCVHPYDACTALIAKEAGIVITDPAGQELAAPLDTTTPVAFLAYANEHLRRQIEPIVQGFLRQKAGASSQ